MPAPGEQHNTDFANPFEEPRPRMAEYTAQQIATLQSRLDKQLGPEFIAKRTGPGGQSLHYVPAEKIIALANDVFGFNGWSSSIQNIQVDFVDEHPTTLKISLGLSVIVRVTLRDGTFHEDIGYGNIENCKSKAMAFEKAKKEGTTDGLKRALRNFGNLLGNCIYDKGYLANVTKIKVQPTKFDENNLYRHADFVKKEDQSVSTRDMKVKEEGLSKEEADKIADLLGELDEADFCVSEDGYPDEIALPIQPVTAPQADTSSSTNGQPTAPPVHATSTHTNNVYSNNTTVKTPNPYSRPHTPHQQPNPRQNQNGNQERPVPRPGHAGPSLLNQPRTTTPNRPTGQPSNGDGAEPQLFFSAKALTQLPESALQGDDLSLYRPAGNQAFNPNKDSPSIRKTPGIDHSSSKPLSRTGQHVAPSTTTHAQTPGASSVAPPRPQAIPAASQGRGNIVNPQLDNNRRIGAPGGPGGPLSNRGAYRPPTMKRPLPVDGNANHNTVARPPLTEVPANTTTNNYSAPDAKRLKPT